MHKIYYKNNALRTIYKYLESILPGVLQIWWTVPDLRKSQVHTNVLHAVWWNKTKHISCLHKMKDWS